MNSCSCGKLEKVGGSSSSSINKPEKVVGGTSSSNISKPK